MITNIKISPCYLSFFLGIQEFIAITFALYSLSQGDAQQVMFYMAVTIMLSLALGILYVFQQCDLARWWLVITLLTGIFFVLISTSDKPSLLWCMATLPTLVSILGQRQSFICLAIVFALSMGLVITNVDTDAIPFLTHQYEDIRVMQLLTSIAILITVSAAINHSSITSLDNYKTRFLNGQEVIYTDALTNLPNRQNMEERLKIKSHEYSVSKANFSIVLADLDNFKLLNDRYGRVAGNTILKQTAALLSNQLRSADTVARWGGNQFLLLFPDTNAQEAKKIADRLRLKFSDLEIQAAGDQLEISVSMGIASIEKYINLDDLISGAENAIYQAKNMGRNCAVVS